VQPIFDSHLHLWDPVRLPYPWLAGNALLDRPFLLADFAAATAGLDVEGMVFVQCEAAAEAAEREAEWVAGLATEESRIRGLVAWAPLELGRAAVPCLERLARHAILCGIRRIIQFEPDLDFCLQSGFVQGVRSLADFGLSFDICVDARHLRNVRRLAELVPDVLMVLDHIGKPAIRDGKFEPWASDLRALAGLPNVWCKISGVATEARHDSWTAAQLRPFIDTAIAAFGFDRIMFGGDWPVATSAIGYAQWVALLEEILSGASADERDLFWRGNAVRFYRLGRQ
jgi:L-fuconolactonase